MLEVCKFGLNVCETKWRTNRGSILFYEPAWGRKWQRIEDVNDMSYRESMRRNAAWGTVKSVLNNRGLRINARKCQHDGVSAPMAL